MRIWSLHPQYLDTKGLLAVWRETLLAKKVLENKTIGYKNHPQLIRFKNIENPIISINFYLHNVWIEAKRRDYNFDKTKFNANLLPEKQITVTDNQIKFEFEHLKKKLITRDNKKYNELLKVAFPKPHPLFIIVSGEIESWEKL